MNTDPRTGTLILVQGDPVDAIPESHRAMLTEAARALFADPPAYFTRLAALCPFPQMACWLTAVAADQRGELHLIPRYPGGKFGSCGYYTQPIGMHSVLYFPPLPSDDYDLGAAPADLQAYYRLVSTLRWGYPGHGGMKDVFGLMPLELSDEFSAEATGLDGAATLDWGSTAAGEAFWYTDAGRAGLLRWEGLMVKPLGSIADAIDWIFGLLIAGQAPTFPMGRI